MKKRIIKIFALLLIFSIIVEPFSVKEVKSANETYHKGDLRCPVNVPGCVEIKNDFGEVISVEVVASNPNTNTVVHKYVTKKEVTADSATYDISFRVESGNGRNTKEAYVVVLMDTSGSMKNSGSLKTAKNAVYSFSKTISDSNLPINIALIQFASTSKIPRGFARTAISTEVMCNYDSKDAVQNNPNCNGLGVGSLIWDGLNNARTLLERTPADSYRYLVVFGDGDYITKSTKDTSNNWGTLPESIQALKGVSNLTRYGLRFPSDFYESNKNGLEKSELGSLHEGVYNKNGNGFCNEFISGNGPYKMTGCFEKIMDEIVGSHVATESNQKNWGKILQDIANQIIKNYTTKGFASGTLTDKVGEKFGGHAIKESVTYVPYSSKNYEITISGENIPDGWYRTNQNFKFDYDYNESSQQIYSEVNPEVYWKNESTQFPACSGISSFSTYSRQMTGIVNDFDYDSTTNTLKSNGSKVILNDRYCRNQVTATLDISKVSGKKIAINKVDGKSFNIIRGIGFPIKISFDETVQCYNIWNQSYYNNLKNKYYELHRVASLTDTKVANFIQTEINKLVAIENSYKALSSKKIEDELIRYSDKFMNDIKPKITVKYKDGTTVYSGNKNLFVNENANQTTGVVCNESKNSCRIELNKNMQLKNVCTSLKTGEIIDCDTNSKNQVIAGNNYYIGDKYFDSVHNKDYYFDKNKTSGTISIKIDKLGFHEVDVTMKDSNDPACTFNLTDGGRNVFYRQIDIRDPFVQQFKFINQRKIGRNFSNEIYKFVNYENDKLSGIIDPNIWSQDYEYLYKISKTNVRNIKRDTGEQNYLGTDCYINENTNQYICPFTRNLGGIDGTDKNYFYSADIK